MSNFKNCQLITHPIISNKLMHLRDKNTAPAYFRKLVAEISRLLAYEVTRDLKMDKKTVETPMEKCEADYISEEFTVVSIMRAGNGMLESVLQMLPKARVGHIGMYRDKFLNSTVEYFFRLPESAKGKRVIVLDPLLATGYTAEATLNRLKEYGVSEIRFVCLLAAPEGIQYLNKMHSDVKIYCASIERTIDENGYILPGVGDAGDRLYSTI